MTRADIALEAELLRQKYEVFRKHTMRSCTPSEVRMWVQLWRHDWQVPLGVTKRQLAAGLGISEQAVRRACSGLIEKRLLTVLSGKGGRGNPAVYVLYERPYTTDADDPKHAISGDRDKGKL